MSGHAREQWRVYFIYNKATDQCSIKFFTSSLFVYNLLDVVIYLICVGIEQRIVEDVTVGFERGTKEDIEHNFYKLSQKVYRIGKQLPGSSLDVRRCLLNFSTWYFHPKNWRSFYRFAIKAVNWAGAKSTDSDQLCCI